MLGIKDRISPPLTGVSLEDMTPADNFYRHVERTLDRSYVIRGTVPAAYLSTEKAICPSGNG